MNIFENLDLDLFYQPIWAKLTTKEKLKILQQIENNMSVIQSRDSREIIYVCKNKKLCYFGMYDPLYPNNIYVYTINDLSSTFDTIVHEGIHALIDDVINEKTKKIHLITKINPTDLTKAISVENTIRSYYSDFERKIELFDLLFFEEQLATYETAIYLLQGIFDISNIHHRFEMKKAILLDTINYYMRCIEIEQKYGKYEKELKNIDFDFLKYEHIDIRPFEITNYNSKVLQEIQQDFESYIQYQLIKSGYLRNDDKIDFSFKRLIKIFRKIYLYNLNVQESKKETLIYLLR